MIVNNENANCENCYNSDICKFKKDVEELTDWLVNGDSSTHDHLLNVVEISLSCKHRVGAVSLKQRSYKED